jgi:RNA polymerase sigma-70 factor (ECF subfamily)
MRTKKRTCHSIEGRDLNLLWRFSLRLTKKPGDAEALLSQCCQRFIERHRSYPNRRQVRCALLRLLYRIWSEQFRSPSLRLHTDSDIATGRGLKIDEHSHNERLVSIIQNLPEAQRLVALLVLVEELSNVETAEILNLSLATVSSRLVGARIAIGQQYLSACRRYPTYNTVA